MKLYQLYLRESVFFSSQTILLFASHLLLIRLLDHLKSEVALMEKLGNSIMNDLETAEYEVCTAWGKLMCLYLLS